MRKKTKAAAAAGMLALALWGCGAAPAPAPAPEPEIEVQTEAAAGETEGEQAAPQESTEEPKETSESASEGQESVTPEEAPVSTGENPEELRALFQDFLEDKAPLLISTIKTEYLMFERSYTFSEMREELNKALRENWGGDEAPQLVSASWAEIDCGNDGIPEFALCLEMNNAVGTNTMLDYCIIKAFNGELLAVEWEEEYYRSFAELNKYGVIFSGGSGGAAIHYTGYRTVDAQGVPQFIYQLEEDFGLKEAIISRYSLPESAVPDSYPDEEFSEDGIVREVYSFTESPEYGTPEYDEYLLHMSYVFLEGEKTVYPNAEMMSLYDNLGITITDPEHVQEMIDRRMSELGLTKEQITQPSQSADNAPNWIVFYDSSSAPSKK